MTNTQSGETKTWIMVVIGILVVGAIAYAVSRNDVGPSMMTDDQAGMGQGSGMPMSDNMMGPVELALSAQNGSKQDGKVTLTQVNGQTKVVIEVAPGPKGVAQPAHLHAGDCNGLGSVKYNLTDVVDGKSETILQPALHFIHGLGQTAINIHKSKAEAGVYVACGNLTEAFNKVMPAQ